MNGGGEVGRGVLGSTSLLIQTLIMVY